MFTIDKDFTGGNINVVKVTGNTVTLKNELRDTDGDWFYWAFRVKNAGGQTLHFDFEENNRVGYYGAAFSTDFLHWKFTETKNGEGFTYTFAQNENEVWFAHHALYHPDRFFSLAKQLSLPVQTLCISEKGRQVPYVTFGNGDKTVLLTARHHACESTGNYVLEGLLLNLVPNVPKDYRFVCIPFVDYDGVVDGDQGKSRKPYDHNRDYNSGKPSIYASVREIRRIAQAENLVYGFDFHSPYHLGGANDHVFIPQKSIKKIKALNRFGEILEEACVGDCMHYHHENDYPPNKGWNKVGSPCFGTMVCNLSTSVVGFTLETTYFGVGDEKFSDSRAVSTGKCFGDAFRKFIAEREKKSGKITFTGDLL